MSWSKCRPAIDGYGPECNSTGDGHLCGLKEAEAEGYLVFIIAERLQGWYGTKDKDYAHARQMIWEVREHDKEERGGG